MKLPKNKYAKHDKELRKWLRKNKGIMLQLQNSINDFPFLNKYWNSLFLATNKELAQDYLDKLVDLWVGARIEKLERKNREIHKKCLQ